VRATAVLGASVIVGVASCAALGFEEWAPEQRPDNTAALRVPQDHVGPLYFIHDPLRGEDPVLTERGWEYRFDEQGVLRLRVQAWMLMPNLWIHAEYPDGTLLYCKRKMRDGGQDQLAVHVWVVWDREEDQERAWHYPGESSDTHEQLARLGVRDLDRTPEREALIVTSKGPQTHGRAAPAFPLEPGPAPPRAVFLVPDDFEGALYLITDRFRGVEPQRDGEDVVYEFPPDGVLRATDTAALEEARSWPRAVERGGWPRHLRALAYSEDPKLLPIRQFLVCRSAEGIPDFQAGGRDFEEQLHLLGERDVRAHRQHESLPDRPREVRPLRVRARLGIL
jgi:hypothetical protein